MSPPVGPPQSPAKQRALRIPLDYYKRWTGLDRAKWLLTALATLVGAAYAGWVVAGYRSGPAARQFSPGHVTLAHAAWNDRCDACHVPGVPLTAQAAGSESLRQVLSGGATAARQLAEQKCVTCHPAASHHPLQLASQVETCSACHHDHAGIDADLKQVASARCVWCHADIAQHSLPAAARLAAAAAVNSTGAGPAATSPAAVGQTAENVAGGKAVNVASWAAHPDFRSLDKGDPGRLKFNHRLHMLPGQYPRDAKPSALKRLGAIDQSYWNLLGYKLDASPDTVVQLDCSACHEFEAATGRLASGGASSGGGSSGGGSGGGGSSKAGSSGGGSSDSGGSSHANVLSAVPATGAYALPIRYERHCASCHDADLAATVEGARGAIRAAVPHAASPATIRGLIRGAWLAADEPAPSGSSGKTAGEGANGGTGSGVGGERPLTPRRVAPGRSLRGGDAGRTTGTSLEVIPVAARVRQAEWQLAGESHCGKCHPFSLGGSTGGSLARSTSGSTSGSTNATEPAGAAAAEASDLLAVSATLVPAIWLPKGGFDHSAHRSMRCDACHEAAGFEWTGGGKPPGDDQKPKIPRIDNCRQCHADSPAITGAPVAVRADCVTCHRYHAANEPPHGHGAPSHTPSPERRVSTREWLEGRYPGLDSATGTPP